MPKLQGSDAASPRPGPLHGVRIIDLSSLIFGPSATQTLGDLGAEVIKIEPPEGDALRVEFKQPNASTRDMGSLFMALNRNKKSVVLDLKNEADRKELESLIATADVFIHNIRAQAIEQLGFGYDRLVELNPSIVYVHCAGFGSDGPYAGRRSTEDLIQAASGAVDTMRDADGSTPYRMLPGLIVDKVCGFYALYATLAALFHRERTGEGQFVEVPMLESFTSFLMIEHLYGAAFEPAVGSVGATQLMSANRTAVASRDGHIAVQPQGRARSAKFLELGGVPDFYNSEAFQRGSAEERLELFHHALRQAAATRTTEEWMALGEEHGIGIMRMNSLKEVQNDPHLRAVDFFQVRDHPDLGKWRATKPPVRFSQTPASIRSDPPKAGAHTKEVLNELKPRSHI